MPQPRVSCIIPIYNASAYLPACIESCLEQTYENLHIVLVNDGSSDDSLSIAQSYCAHPQISLINLHQNYGVGAARNSGMDFVLNCKIVGGGGRDKTHLEHPSPKEPTPHKRYEILKTATLPTPHSPHDFLIFIDNDDLLAAPDSIQTLVSSATTHQADITLGIITTIDEGGEILQRGRKSLLFGTSSVMEPKDFLSKILHYYFAIGPATLLSTSLLSRHAIRFPESTINEDLPFGFECFLHANRVASVEIPTYLYRRRLGSISHPDTFSHHKISLLARSYLHNTHYLQDLLYRYPDTSFTHLIERCLAYNASPTLIYATLEHLQNSTPKNPTLADLLPYASPKAKFCYYAPRVFKLLRTLRQWVKNR